MQISILQTQSLKLVGFPILFLSGIFLGMTSGVENTDATSGACSSHGGVNCAAGADWDGSVICEDGWTDSSVSYAEMSSCGSEDTSTSTLEVELLSSYCSDSVLYWTNTLSDLRNQCGETYYGTDYTTQCWDDYKTEMETYGLSYSFSNAVNSCTAQSLADYTTCYYDAFDQTLASCKEESQADSSLFTDLATSDPYYQAISSLYQSGVIQGYNDSTYRPDLEINRAEFVKILIAWTDTSAFNDFNWDCFTDVSSAEWYAKYVFIAKSLGVIEGYPDGSFGPANTINVAEALKITFNFMKFDVPEVSGEWYQKYVEYAQIHDLYLSSWTSPDQALTRGEMAELIYRAMNGF